MVEPEASISNNNRGNFDIIADILEASCELAKKANLMYRCNLSSKQFRSYSRFMVENGLLHLNSQASESKAGAFQVTWKGMKFLKAYRGLKALMK